jgi:hypothetical protein
VDVSFFHKELKSPRYNFLISIQRRVANVYSDATRSAVLKAFIGQSQPSIPPPSMPSPSAYDYASVWMTGAPACLVCGIDTGQKSIHSKRDEHAVHSAAILNMISGAGGVTISNDISSIQVSLHQSCWRRSDRK